MLRWLGPLAILVCVAGCQKNDERRPAPPGTKVRAAPSAVTRAHVPAKPVNKAVLDAGGIVFDSRAGKTREFTFGASRDEVEAMAVRTFGPPDERSSNGECGAGPMDFSRYGALTLNFQRGKLVGWLAREGSGSVTSDGIRPGSFMRDLQVARSVRMIDGSTLAGEFDYLAADGHAIGGFASGDGRDAKIDSLYAGENCFFR